MDREENGIAEKRESGKEPAYSGRNPIRRLYEWVLGWAESPWGGAALFILAFCESSFFPVPPDVLLIALALGSRRKSFRYAAICTVGSVAGGAAGYALGMAAAPLGKTLVTTIADEALYFEVARKYGENAFAAIAVAGFTPIPYKVFTVTAGIFHETVPFGTLIAASVLSRGLRFFLLAILVWAFGRPVKKFIEKYFNLLSIIFVVLLAGGFYVAALAGGGDDPAARARVLVRELSLPDTEMRAKAHESLKELALSAGKAQDFGFNPEKDADANAGAVRAWENWVEESIRDGRFGKR